MPVSGPRLAPIIWSLIRFMIEGASAQSASAWYCGGMLPARLRPSEKTIAQALTCLMHSKIVAFQLALGASNVGIKQPKIEKVDLEALIVPDLLVNLATKKKVGAAVEQFLLLAIVEYAFRASVVITAFYVETGNVRLW